MKKSNKFILYITAFIILLGAASLGFYLWRESQLAPPMKDLSDGVFPHVFSTRNPELQKELKRLYDEKCLPKQLMAANPKIPDEQNIAVGLKELWNSNEFKELSEAYGNVSTEYFFDIKTIKAVRKIIRKSVPPIKPGKKPTKKEKIETALINANTVFGKNIAFMKNLSKVLDRPKCNFEVDYLNVFHLHLKHTLKMRSISRMESFFALWAMANDKTELALDSLRNIFRTAATIKDEPFLISHLIFIALESIGISTAQAICLDTNNEGILEKVKNIIEKELELPDTKHAFSGERLYLLATFEKAHKEGIGAIVSIYGGTGKLEDIIASLYDRKYKKASDLSYRKFLIITYKSDPDLLYSLKHIKEIQKTANRPWFEFKKKSLPLAFPPKKYLISLLSMPQNIAATQKASILQANFFAAYIALSKRLGKEVDKKYLTNPMTGKPFKTEETNEFIKVTAEDTKPYSKGKDFSFKVWKKKPPE